MKKKELDEEAKELLDQVSVEEALAKVWAKWETSLAELSEEEAYFYSAYLNGNTIEKISRTSKVSEREIGLLLEKVKKQMVTSLKKGHLVRH